MAEKRIYMDNNATTPLHPDVKEAMNQAMDVFGNPSSLHGFGREARAMVETARAQVASFIGATPEEVFFVGSGSEANNTVLSIFSCEHTQCACPIKTNNKIITSRIEHPCILETSKCMQRKGAEVVFIDVDAQGKIKLDQLERALDDKTALVSVMLANNEIGTIQDIKKISALAQARKILVHTDAVQAVGKIPVNVKALGVDFLTISGHKIYGPKGIGALYVRKGVPFCPLILGGHQEKGRRAGTENTLGIIGLGRAIALREKEMAAEEKELLRLKGLLREGLKKNIPDTHVNGHPTDCLPGTLNVSFAGAEGEAILLYLDLEGIAVSTGSACSSGSLDPSHVLLATGVSAEQAHGSIRLSLGRENTEEEVPIVIDALTRVIKRVRDMSTAYQGTSK